MNLEPVINAAADLKAAEDRLRAEVVSAREQGGTVAEIARAAGVTRQTVYRWAREPVGRRSPMQVMEEGLQVLLELGTGPSHELMAAIRTQDAAARARRVRLLIGNVPNGYDEEQGLILQRASHAAYQVIKRSEQGQTTHSDPGED